MFKVILQIDLFSGHKSNLFAFAEKVQHGRIFIITYPAFNILAELTGIQNYSELSFPIRLFKKAERLFIFNLHVGTEPL